MNKQIFLRYSDGDFSLLSAKQKQLFGRYHDHESYGKRDNVQSEFIVSMRFEKDKKDIGIYFWVEDFSIGFTRDELLKVLRLIEDEDKIKMMIATEVI